MIENGTETTRSRAAILTGHFLFGLSVLFLAFDTALKAFAMRAAVEGTVRLGYPAETVRIIGLIEVFCLAVLLVPRTALIGAILWTAYLGGAVATHTRAGSSLFAETLFPVYFAIMLWTGLWLRDRRVGALLAPAAPFRR
jgi:hypothetical protein